MTGVKCEEAKWSLPSNASMVPYLISLGLKHAVDVHNGKARGRQKQFITCREFHNGPLHYTGLILCGRVGVGAVGNRGLGRSGPRRVFLIQFSNFDILRSGGCDREKIDYFPLASVDEVTLFEVLNKTGLSTRTKELCGNVLGRA